MGQFINTPVATLLFSLYVAVALSPAAGYRGYTYAPPPSSFSTSPSPSTTFSTSPSPSPFPSTTFTRPSSPSPSTTPSPSPSLMSTMQGDEDNLYIMPKDEQAKDSRYLTAHMSAAVNHVEGFLEKEVEGKLKHPATADYDKECLTICKEVYESAVESMKRGMESVSAGDFIKASFDVSAFNTDVDTCGDCTDAFDEFDQWAKGVAGDCLDKIVKHTNRF